MINLAQMSGEELQALYTRTFSEWRAMAYAMIYAGYGNATHEQVQQRAIFGDDPLADRFLSINAKLIWVKDEFKRRLIERGDLEPIMVEQSNDVRAYMASVRARKPLDNM